MRYIGLTGVINSRYCGRNASLICVTIHFCPRTHCSRIIYDVPTTISSTIITFVLHISPHCLTSVKSRAWVSITVIVGYRCITIGLEKGARVFVVLAQVAAIKSIFLKRDVVEISSVSSLI